MSSLAYLVEGILVLWFLVSVPAQLPEKWFVARGRFQRVLYAVLRPRDPLGFIPRWTFFAPNPGTHDYHLLFRCGDSPTELCLWTEVALVERWSLRRAIWNPYKREKKAFVDHVVFLLDDLAWVVGDDSRDVQLSVSYLVFLNFVSQLAYPNSLVQFLIVESPGDAAPRTEPSRPLFLSFLHEVEPWG